MKASNSAEPIEGDSPNAPSDPPSAAAAPARLPFSSSLSPFQPDLAGEIHHRQSSVLDRLQKRECRWTEVGSVALDERLRIDD